MDFGSKGGGWVIDQQVRCELPEWAWFRYGCAYRLIGSRPMSEGTARNWAGIVNPGSWRLR